MADVVQVETVVVDKDGDTVKETPAPVTTTVPRYTPHSYFGGSYLARSGLHGSYLGGYGSYLGGYGSRFGHGYGLGWGGYGYGGYPWAGSWAGRSCVGAPKVCAPKVEAKAEVKVEAKVCATTDTVAETLRRSKQLVESLNA
jgi:hypothetical protein